MQFLKLVWIPWLIFTFIIIEQRFLIIFFIIVQSIWWWFILITLLIYILVNSLIFLRGSRYNISLWFCFWCSIFIIKFFFFVFRRIFSFYLFFWGSTLLLSISVNNSLAKWLRFMMVGIINLSTWSQYICIWCIRSTSLFIFLLLFQLSFSSSCLCLSICWKCSLRFSSFVIPKHILI